MKEIKRIQSALRPHLPWHGARLAFVALFLSKPMIVEPKADFAPAATFSAAHSLNLSWRPSDFDQAFQLFCPRTELNDN